LQKNLWFGITVGLWFDNIGLTRGFIILVWHNWVGHIVLTTMGWMHRVNNFNIKKLCGYQWIINIGFDQIGLTTLVAYCEHLFGNIGLTFGSPRIQRKFEPQLVNRIQKVIILSDDCTFWNSNALWKKLKLSIFLILILTFFSNITSSKVSHLFIFLKIVQIFFFSNFCIFKSFSFSIFL